MEHVLAGGVEFFDGEASIDETGDVLVMSFNAGCVERCVPVPVLMMHVDTPCQQPGHHLSTWVHKLVTMSFPLRLRRERNHLLPRMFADGDVQQGVTKLVKSIDIIAFTVLLGDPGDDASDLR